MTTDSTISTVNDDDDSMFTCEHCDESRLRDDARSVRVSRRIEQVWCESCVDDDAHLCASCDEFIASEHATDVHIISSGAYNRRQRSTAHYCMPCIESDGIVSNEDTGEYATQEYADAYWYFWNSDDCYHSDSEPDDDDDDDDDGLHDYGTDVIREHGWPGVTRRDSLCFGVELEMEATRSRRDAINYLGGRDGNGTYILKTDGSLDEGGIELVTLPYTLDHHATRFNWAGILRPLGRNARSGSGTTRCGMHVHANRAALTALQIGKALVFLNCAANASFVSYVAQRSSNGYCERDSSKKIKDAKHGFSRYDMLNISGRRTIEFRLFRGNLRPERILKNIEFCHALLTYCADASMREIERAKFFCDWTLARSKTYPNLVRFLRAGSYLPQRAPVPAQYAQPEIVDA